MIVLDKLFATSDLVKMEILIKSLSQSSIDEIKNAFNEAFRDYLINIELSYENLIEKICLENILLEKSASAFSEGCLVGFILIGIDEIEGKRIAYNAGTGVIPGFRGNRLSAKMYDFLFGLLASEAIDSHQLEVITTNSFAFRAYEKIGFTRAREVCCFKGKALKGPFTEDISLRLIDLPKVSEINGFWNFAPAYQNSFSAIKRSRNSNKIAGAFQNGSLIGYIVFSADNARVRQFGVSKEFRRSGVGHALFSFAQENFPGKELSIINIDKRDFETLNFLQRIGLSLTIEQYEMKLSPKCLS